MPETVVHSRATAAEWRAQARRCAADLSRWSEAVVFSRRAVEAEPDNAAYWALLGRDLARVGELDEALVCLERAVSLRPDDPAVRASWLWYLHYHPGWTPDRIASQYRRWGRDFAPERPLSFQRDRTPDRRLRVGYVSPDYRRHSVAYYIEAILDGHDRREVELVGYGNVPHPDETTARLRAKFDHYVDIHGWDDAALVDRLRRDRLDIVVAVAGHCTGNRLLALAQRVAPIQVDLGGICTTGMPQIDYRITDAWVDPPDAQRFYCERLVSLPDGWTVFAPPPVSPPVSPAPAGPVTLGSFNNPIKLNGDVLVLWARILQARPQTRLLLKFPAAVDAGIRARFRGRFERLGIPADRLEFCGELPTYEHLASLGRAHLALDAFPFNGGMTTLEGLWMGVPIVTLTGHSCVGRCGGGILHRLGLDLFIAESPQQYVEKACAFIDQPGALAQIRAGLRALMLRSVLCHPGRMARQLETAYRQMWSHWCHNHR